jgi:hypothetical protein
MRISGFICAALAVVGTSGAGLAAEFPYAVDATVFYQGAPPPDGNYLRQNFLITATTEDFAPKNLNIYADLSTGPGTPVVQQLSCNVGEIQPGWTAAYRGVSCNWSNEVSIPPGQTLYASVSNAFSPFTAADLSSTFPVITEAIKPYPGKTPPAACAPPPAKPDAPGLKSSVSVDVYQLPGAIAPDGSFDQSKICVVATPHGQDVAGLRLWGTLTARHGGEESFIGSYMCIIANAPDITAAGTAAFCSPRANNDAPTNMLATAKNAKLFVSTTVTFGHVQSAASKPIPVQMYGTPDPK